MGELQLPRYLFFVGKVGSLVHGPTSRPSLRPLPFLREGLQILHTPTLQVAKVGVTIDFTSDHAATDSVGGWIGRLLERLHRTVLSD